jgi:hypothetical protein
MTVKYVLKGTFIDENTGKEISSTTSTKKIPDLDAFETSGFASAFNDLETAVIEARQEVEKGATQNYLEATSKKKSIRSSSNLTRKKGRTQK